ncbi:MAG: 3-oxoacyl-ACP reductase family protein [Rhodothermales bacterium]|nr:3-oxoacyl-ACP reductase family protein [Rhodothermales bacterium]
MSINNRVALVTGSSTGLGNAIALDLARQGARVAMNYANNQARAEEAFAELEAIGRPCLLARADVTDAEQVTSLCDRIARELGPIDILVPNATPDQPQRRIEEYDWALFQQMIDFFVKSPYLLTRACLPHMKRQRWGRIITITSEVFSLGVAPFTAYVSAKGGQVGLSRSLATELAPYGITVNMVSPGWIPVARHEKDPQEMKDAYLRTIPVRRWGLPEDVAGAVTYLASEEAGFVIGQTLTVNGGRSFL